MILQALLRLAAAYLGYLFLNYPSHALGTRSRPDLAGPKGWPLIGNLPLVLRISARSLEYLCQHSRPGSTLSLPFGLRFIDISSPAQIEHVQKTNFENYRKGPFVAKVAKDVFGRGIFAVDGPAWVTQRKVTSHIFTSNSFKGVFEPAIISSIGVLHERLEVHSESGDEFDLCSLFFAFTLSSFMKMAFSQDIGCLTAEADVQVPFATAFDFAQSCLAARLANPFWQITERFTELGIQMKESVKIIDDFVGAIIESRVGGKDEEKKPDKDLLDLYMNSKDENGAPISPKGLRDAVINILVAGRDTTAQALSWTFYRLLKEDPSILATLREEVDRLGEVNFATYKNFVQIHAALNEGLRLHPPVPKAAWEAIGEDVLPGGTKVYPGERVRWSDWQMARDATVWGEDCCEYKPSRWIDESGNLIRVPSSKFHAFNSGPRLCLGQQLANFEAISVIAEIVRSFDLDFAPDYLATVEKVSLPEATPLYGPSLTLPMKQPLRVLIKRRF